MNIKINTAVPYEVIIGRGTLSNVGELICRSGINPQKALLLSESNVFPLFGERVRNSLEGSGFKVYEHIFRAGEQSKTLESVNDIYKALSEGGFTRSDLIVNLGGGVTGDMGGFAAATFLRGMKFIQLPTSLLSQVDASVGGKTGVDTRFGKNLVGAFHQPSAVIIDPETLLSLPEFYFRDGMGEVIKYGCIDDAGLFSALSEADVREASEDIIFRCVDSKRRFVEEDAGDTGKRMLLNFGHTFGHAIEKLEGFGSIAHGEAVGIGMAIAAGLGEKAGLTEAKTSGKIKELLRRYSLKTDCGFSAAELVGATALDKKSDGEYLNLILLERIGRAFIRRTTRKEILALMQK